MPGAHPLQLSNSPIALLQALQILSRGDAQELEALAAWVGTDHASALTALENAKLAGQFYALSLETPVLSAFPAGSQAALAAAYERQSGRNRQYVDLMVAFRDGCREQGIELLLLKGLHIGQRFSGGIDRRFMWDADVLVASQRLADAVAVAEGLGLESAGNIPSLRLLSLASLHAIEVKERGTAVDIHWCLRDRPGYRIDYSRIWQGARSMAIDGQAFNVLSDEDALLLAILEIASDIERSRIKLRSLWDAYQMLSALDPQVDWPAFLDLRRKEGLFDLAINMLSFFLLSLDCRDQCPQLSGELRSCRGELAINDREVVSQILERPAKHLANRVLYARLQPRPVVSYWLRRMLTSPLRGRLMN